MSEFHFCDQPERVLPAYAWSCPAACPVEHVLPAHAWLCPAAYVRLVVSCYQHGWTRCARVHPERVLPPAPWTCSATNTA